MKTPGPPAGLFYAYRGILTMYESRYVPRNSRQQISEYLPPLIRDELVKAAMAHDAERIDELTDMAARNYPDLVVPRHVVRPHMVNVSMK